jgi:hypothetical protein
MFDLFRLWFGTILRIVRRQRSLVLENLVLRQQLVVLKRKHPRPRLGPLDKLFWLGARRFWPQWKEALVIVLPDTVVRWHRSGFTLYWTMLCKVRKQVGGGRRISRELFQMVAENPSWGAPRIHGELLMLVSETTISRWMRRAPRRPEPAERWLAFLRNHREAIAAMDFFTVPTTVGFCDTDLVGHLSRAFSVSQGCSGARSGGQRFGYNRKVRRKANFRQVHQRPVGVATLNICRHTPHPSRSLIVTCTSWDVRASEARAVNSICA